MAVQTQSMVSEEDIYKSSNLAQGVLGQAGLTAGQSVGVSGSGAITSIEGAGLQGINAISMGAMNAINGMNAASLATVNKENKEALKKQNDAAKKG